MRHDRRHSREEACFTPALLHLRNTAAFRWAVVTGGSVAIAVIAVGWFGERALNVRIF